MASFEDAVFDALDQCGCNVENDLRANTLLKFLVEMRESAHKNRDYETFDKIGNQLQEQFGIQLKEDIRVIATKVER